MPRKPDDLVAYESYATRINAAMSPRKKSGDTLRTLLDGATAV